MKPIVSARAALVITDASCLILLDKIGHLDLLPILFSKVITTPEIISEYGSAAPHWMLVITVFNKKLQSQFADIVDAGEASALALAQEITNDYVIIDDMQARKLAAKLGLNIIGTLGILLKAKQAGLIAVLKPVLEKVEKTNFRTTKALIESILRYAGE
ncbi:DUF3368 domain-containing protein [Mucilaginibacter psychrotolerans]|uniref:DUF3368 domain-containing protein n=1 Tax=Mucilaginibacter psychrotolerans TaxID=1524096 RepID=A0A4Y8SQ04_9SPHI|nr:DUF3368 domain-containing protein [Mucilaginibacter psychrotolerans]TFF40765.1 DUF3368 domain-containing protein [Mucilaginibacter psychrotolerans]